MNIDTLRRMLAWSTLINYVILIIWFVAFTLAHDWIRELHGRWFRMSPEQFDLAHYFGISIYKIGIMLFNLAPYLALHIMRYRSKA